MTHRVAVLAFDGISPFHLSVPTIVFAGEGMPATSAPYSLTVFSESPGVLSTRGGYDILVHAGLEAVSTADTVIVPSWDETREPPVRLLDTIRRAHDRGARIVALCLGAYVVAASGIVDGRELATHWHAARALAARYPAVNVRADVLFSDLGDVVSSAGTAAALDCCLHIVRSDLGARAAADVARRIVLAPHRSGSQSQFIPVPVFPEDDHDAIGDAMTWGRAHLDEPIGLDELAAAAHVSRRTLTRRFRARTGMSPGEWILVQRVDRARELLEDTDLPVERVAQAAGFGNPASLRMHMRRALGTSPRAHREAFRATGAPA